MEKRNRRLVASERQEREKEERKGGRERERETFFALEIYREIMGKRFHSFPFFLFLSTYEDHIGMLNLFCSLSFSKTKFSSR